MRKVSIDTIKERIAEKHGDVVTLDESTYKDTHSMARFVDKDLGEFWSLVQPVYLGRSHPARKQEKMKATCLKRYGVEHATQNKDILSKRQQSIFDKYGVNCVFNLSEVKEKIKQTNLQNLGVENPFASKVIQEQIKQTHLETLGVEYATQSPEIKEKIRQTNLERYDTSCPLQHPEVHAKTVETLMKDLGVENAMQSEVIQEKRKATCLDKYGFEHPLQNKEVQDRKKTTCNKRFGVDFPAQNLEIARRAAKNMNKSIKKVHWKTGQEIICIASYEEKVVDRWNANKIDFMWQEKSFEMPDGRYYIPDAYVPSLDKWIEIKGYMREDAKEKWEWFHKEHSNSELWDKKKLKEMGIL